MILLVSEQNNQKYKYAVSARVIEGSKDYILCTGEASFYDKELYSCAIRTADAQCLA